MAKATTQSKLTQAAVDQLAIIGGQLTKDDDVVFGPRWEVPETYRGDLPGALKFFNRYVESQTEEVNVSATFDYRPYDVAAAVERAMKEVFGAAVGKKDMWGNPPQRITINCGYEASTPKTMTVPWDNMELPGIPGYINIGKTRHDEKGVLGHLSAVCMKQHEAVVQGFYEVVRRQLDQESIYRGKAFNGHSLDPGFYDTEAIDPSRFIYAIDAWTQLDTNILSPMRNAPLLRERGLSPKRTVVLEGEYGTGKTGMLRTASKRAVEYGWTSITCRPGQDDPFECIKTAALYADGTRGSIVLIEDIDVIADSMDPGYVSRLLDAFDGYESKDQHLVLVLTTNHIDRIHKGMLRPGRLDAVIHIGSMDVDGVEQLCRMVLADDLEDDIDFAAIHEACEGFAPAWVREAIDRSIRFSVARTGEVSAVGTADLIAAIESLYTQLGLQRDAKDEQVVLPHLDEQFRRMISEHANDDRTDYNEVFSQAHSAALRATASVINETKAALWDAGERHTEENVIYEVELNTD